MSETLSKSRYDQLEIMLREISGALRGCPLVKRRENEYLGVMIVYSLYRRFWSIE